MIRRPTTVEPVKETLSTSGCEASSSPTVAPPPVMTFTTPLGRSVSSSSSARRSAVSGVLDAGLSTQELPIASAGASFQTAMTSGKFQGMIPAQTPIGSRSTKLYEWVGNSTGSSGLLARPPGLASEVVPVVDAVADHHVARGAHRHARLERLELGQLVLVLGELVDHRAHDPHALVGVHLGPDAGVERLAGRARSRSLRVLAPALGDGGDELAARGVDHVEGLAGGGVDPLPADVVLVRLDVLSRSYRHGG